jgi:hypothetical protein
VNICLITILFRIVQKRALKPLLLNFALEYAIKMLHENQVRLKLNRAHQLLVNADDVTLLRNDINTIKKNTEALSDVERGFV